MPIESEVIKTGTSTVGITFDGGVVVGAKAAGQGMSATRRQNSTFGGSVGGKGLGSFLGAISYSNPNDD